jgi:hypothetical protein
MASRETVNVVLTEAGCDTLLNLSEVLRGKYRRNRYRTSTFRVGQRCYEVVARSDLEDGQD